MTQEHFNPPVWCGQPRDFQLHNVYEWVGQLSTRRDIYCQFWNGFDNANLPPGYNYYIVSWHTENTSLPWLQRQRKLVDGRIIVLSNNFNYNCYLENVYFINYITLHQDLNKMIDLWGVKETNLTKQYKFSTVCNRISQSKLWITTKLLESANHDSLIILNSWLEDKNVHGWQLTGNSELDNLTNVFRDKYLGTIIGDGFDPADNCQIKNSNPWQPLYTDSAIHFVNSSFHYSFMVNGDQEYIYPGPDIDEKTLKCLLAGVAFVPCGQFEFYKTLEKFGLEFNYGFDQTWDQDSGNITRFHSIVKLIDELKQYSTNKLIALTNESTEYNKNFILTQQFYRRCEKNNNEAIDKIFSLLDA